MCKFYYISYQISRLCDHSYMPNPVNTRARVDTQQNVYSSKGRRIENISCLSALIILHSNCSSPSCAKTRRIICGATEQLLSAKNKIEVEERMQKLFRVFLPFLARSDGAELTRT